MFNFYGKGRFIKTLFEGEGHEIILFESMDHSKVVVHVGKEFENIDILKSGEWVMAKLKAKANSKMAKDGSIYFNTLIRPDKVRELFDDELVSVRKEVDEYEKMIQDQRKARIKDKGLNIIAEKINLENEVMEENNENFERGNH